MSEELTISSVSGETILSKRAAAVVEIGLLCLAEVLDHYRQDKTRLFTASLVEVPTIIQFLKDPTDGPHLRAFLKRYGIKLTISRRRWWQRRAVTVDVDWEKLTQVLYGAN